MRVTRHNLMMNSFRVPSYVLLPGAGEGCTGLSLWRKPHHAVQTNTVAAFAHEFLIASHLACQSLLSLLLFPRGIASCCSPSTAVSSLPMGRS